MCYKETSLRNAWMKPNGAGVCFIDFCKETKKVIHQNVVIKKTYRDMFIMCYRIKLMHFVYVMHKSYVTVHTL